MKDFIFPLPGHIWNHGVYFFPFPSYRKFPKYQLHKISTHKSLSGPHDEDIWYFWQNSNMLDYLNIIILNSGLTKYTMHFGGSEKLSRPDTKRQNEYLSTALQDKYGLYAIKKSTWYSCLHNTQNFFHPKCIERKTIINRDLSVKLNLLHYTSYFTKEQYDSVFTDNDFEPL